MYIMQVGLHTTCARGIHVVHGDMIRRLITHVLHSMCSWDAHIHIYMHVYSCVTTSYDSYDFTYTSNVYQHVVHVDEFFLSDPAGFRVVEVLILSERGTKNKESEKLSH